MNDFSRDLAKEAYGMTPDEAWAKGICMQCKKIPEFKTRLGRKEYRISALCEPCWDSIMSAIEDEGDDAISQD